MNPSTFDTVALEKAALSVRALSMDAIQKANSGHPGLPLGAAELGVLLYGEILRQDPAAPDWPDRDRFVLSAGHGSAMLYALLHLAGYADMTMEELKNFRQAGSRAAGHPEYGLAGGIEATTGPLGQGIGMAAGMAIAETMLAARFNTPGRKIVDHRTWALCGEGCLEEGVSAEAFSLAGHLGLGKLTVFYDANRISIDGSTDLAFTEDVAKRCEASGWQVLRGSMYDFAGIMALVETAEADAERPALIILESVIGKGAPNRQNTAEAHGAPLGKDEILLARKALGIPENEDFYTAPEARGYFAAKRPGWTERRRAWEAEFAAWSAENPGLRGEWDRFFSGAAVDTEMPAFAAGEMIATRAAGQKALQAMAAAFPNLVGGSADLKGSNGVALPAAAGVYSRRNRAGRYIHFGVREFGMAAIANGIALHGGLRVFCATFLVFADYLRAALRLSALQKLPVIYVLTHDSIYMGEDGPTHQPVEHLASLRAVPNLRVLRPADAEEASLAWEMALERRGGPTVLAMSRQNLPVLEKNDGWQAAVKRAGAWIVKDAPGGRPGVVLLATGSELSLALEAAALVESGRTGGAADGGAKKIRVISVPCRELFLALEQGERDAFIPPGARTVVAEAGVAQGWERLARPEDILSIERFGESAPAAQVAERLGFTARSLAAIIAR